MNDLRPSRLAPDYLILTVGPLQVFVPRSATEQQIDLVRASLARINASVARRAAFPPRWPEPLRIEKRYVEVKTESTS